MREDEPRRLRPFLQAARRALDGRTLLPGEDPAASALEAIAYWIDVYTHLIAVEEAVLTEIRAITAHASPAVHDESERSNVPLIEGQLERFKSRLEFWKHRQRDRGVSE